MKKSIYDQGEPKDNMMLAALKQAVANLKATNSMTGQTDSISEPTDTSGRDERSDAEIAKLLPSYFEADKWDGLTARAQQRLISQTGLTPQEQWRLLNMKKSKLKDLVDQNASDDKYADIIEATQKKGVNFSGSDAETLKDEQNALRTINGARAKQVTNAYKSADSATMHKEQNALREQNPVPFTKSKQPFESADAKTMHDEQRIINIASEANKALDKILTSINLDLGDLTPLAKSYIAYARLKIANYAIDGKLTKYVLDNIIYDTADSIARNVTPPPGTSYIQLIRQRNPQEVIPGIGTLKTDVLTEEEWGQLKANTNEKYKQDVYNEAANEYRYALNHGTAWLRDFQAYYDKAVLKYYNNCVRPIYLRKDKNGNGIGESVPIGELIDPNDNSFGAQLVREAIQLIGLGYLEPAGQGKYDKMEIDCSRLVNWAVAQTNEDWGINGISKKAGYQMAAFEEPIWNRDNDGSVIKYEDLRVGDTLFWKGVETGDIKHTAIYIGMNEEGIPFMIEAGKSVQIVPVRWHTTNNNGEDSTLFQINRMTMWELQQNAEKNIR